MKRDEFLRGLENFKRSIDKSLEEMQNDWQAIPPHVQLGYLEGAKEEVERVVEQLNAKIAELQEAQQKNARYNKGPKKKQGDAKKHIKAIDDLIREKMEERPERSAANARQAANKEYGLQHGKPQGFYGDDYLRNRLKAYRAESKS